jgi:transcriptional regulator with PAS, ATPase and Fis domain
LITKICAREGKPIADIADNAKRVLLAYEWPGNIRELENVIERSVILTGSDNRIELSFMIDGSFLGPTLVTAPEVNKIAETEIAHQVLDRALAIRTWKRESLKSL